MSVNNIGNAVSFLPVTLFGAKGDGSTDDSAAFQAALNYCAGTGLALWIPTGTAASATATYVIASPLTVPSNTTIWGSPGVTLKSTIVGTGFTKALFFCQGTNLGTVASQTITSSTTKGNRTLPMTNTTGFAVGQNILVSSVTNVNNAQQFTITAVTTNVSLTVDDPVQITFVNGDTVKTFNPPADIHIWGNGMQCVGSGGALFEIAAGNRCTIADVYVPTTTVTSYVASFDIASRDCGYIRCHFNGGNSAPYCYSMESSSRCFALECSATNTAVGGAGFWIPGSSAFEIAGCWAWNCGYGAYISYGNSTDPDGCMRGTIHDTQFFSNANYGISFFGSHDIDVSNVECNYNTSGGFYFGNSGAGNPCYVNLTNCRASDTSGVGFYFDTGSHIVTGNNWSADRCVTAAVETHGACRVFITGFRSEDCCLNAGNAVVNLVTGSVCLTGAHIRHVSNQVSGSWVALQASNATTNQLFANHVLIEQVSGTGTLYGINVNLCTMRLQDVVTKGTLTQGLLGNNGVAAILWRGSGCDFSSCTTPFALDGTILANFGTFTLNGTTAVVVGHASSFPIEAGIALSLNAVGSTPGTGAPYFSAAQTAGTFTVKSPTANANDVYNWHAY